MQNAENCLQNFIESILPFRKKTKLKNIHTNVE